MIYGTSHFTDESAAYLYYKDYGFTRDDVKRKLAEGEIHVGKPSVKPGEKVLLNREEMRYFIEG